MNLGKIDLSKIHDCEKCRGKLVSITVDLVGIERCGYCGQVVDYSGYIKKHMGEEQWEKMKKGKLLQ